ncbi:MAG: hypothetical protein ACRDOH_15800 [Streptosporangiaceae bacterium]
MTTPEAPVHTTPPASTVVSAAAPSALASPSPRWLSRDQLAVTFADQVGAALATSHPVEAS